MLSLRHVLRAVADIAAIIFAAAAFYATILFFATAPVKDTLFSLLYDSR